MARKLPQALRLQAVFAHFSRTAAAQGVSTALEEESSSPSTVPYFSDTFVSGGTTYTYTMVGRNPPTTHAVSVVPTLIVPLRFVFADGNAADSGETAVKVLTSPIFIPTQFSSGLTH